VIIMSLMRRSALMLRSWFAAVLEPALDPRRAFAEADQRHRLLLARVRHALATLSCAKLRLQSRAADLRGRVQGMEAEAQEALASGRENMSRLVLERRYAAARSLEAIEAEVRDLEREEQRLATVDQRLGTQIEAFRARQEVMAARHSAAEAQVRLTEAFTGVSGELGDLGLTLDQVEERTQRLENRAAALDHLVDSGLLDAPGSGAGGIDRQLAEMDRPRAIQEQIEALKRRMEGVERGRRGQ
jgi:phage shock protein A